MPWRPGTRMDKKQVLTFILSIAVVVALVGLIIGDSLSKSSNGSTNPTNTGKTNSTKTPGQGQGSPTNAAVSPLLFGTNLGLFDSSDQVLNSVATRTALSQMHTRIIRMPVRSSLSEATEVAAAQIIKNVDAIPLIILRGAVDSSVLADDTRIVNDMNRIFGNSVVYYEYGNEEDLQGVDVARYTASWNAIVPQLKRIALHGQFVGPVNFQYDRAYLTSFLQNAHPRPDEVSWHEYTCDDSWANDICISHIDHWTNHISDARAAMIATIGTALPIMITEWNYAPNAVPNDGKNNNSNFMTTWTTKALQTLAANRVFASMQYSCTNTAIPLIDGSGTLTAQGLVFQGQYQQMIIAKQQPASLSTPSAGGSAQATPTPDSSNPTSTAVTNSNATFSFEDGGTDGWSGHGSQIANVQNSATFGMGDTHSLQVTLTNLTHSDYPYVAVGRSDLANYPQAGQTLTAYVYQPSNSNSFTAKLFVMDNNYRWFSNNTMISLTPGQWNRLTFTLPSNLSGQPRLLGIQFSNAVNSPESGDVYIDQVGWGP